MGVQIPHQVQIVLVAQGHHGLTGGPSLRFPELTLKVCQTLRVATLIASYMPVLKLLNRYSPVELA